MNGDGPCASQSLEVEDTKIRRTPKTWTSIEEVLCRQRRRWLGLVLLLFVRANNFGYMRGWVWRRGRRTDGESRMRFTKFIVDGCGVGKRVLSKTTMTMKK